MRGRGGGIEDILYQNLTGKVEAGLQMTLNYHTSKKTNSTATPEIRGITIRDVHVSQGGTWLDCEGLDDSEIEDITFENVVVKGGSKEKCSHCKIKIDSQTSPKPSCSSPTPTPPAPTPPGPAPTPPAPTPPRPPASSFTKHSKSYWSTSKGKATREYDGSKSSVDACATKCLSDDDCAHFDYVPKKETCRTYHGSPTLMASSNGYDAYEKVASPLAFDSDTLII